MANYDPEKTDANTSGGDGEHVNPKVHPERRDGPGIKGGSGIGDGPGIKARPGTKADDQERKAVDKAEAKDNKPEGKEIQAPKTSGRRRKLIGGGIAGLVVGGFGSLFSVIQGPLQFIQFLQNIVPLQNGPVEIFGDDSSARFVIYALAGKSAKGRLGINANRRATKWETRLNANGLKSVYSTGTQRGIGYQVTDRTKASRFLKDMGTRGIPTNSSFPSGSVTLNPNGSTTPIDRSITGVDLSNESSFRRRNSVTRGATRSLKINRIRAALGARLLIKRSGMDGLFHPFKKRARQTADNFAQRRHDRRESERNRMGTGDADIDIGETRLGKLRRRIATSLRTAKGPAIAAAVLCGAKSFSASIDAQALESELTMIRMGLTAAARGDQIKSFQDLSFADLAIDNDHFYDPETQTHYTSDPGIQYEMGKEPTGRDYAAENDLKPGGEKFAAFRAVDGIPDLGVCSAFNAAGEYVSGLPIIEQFGDLVDAAVDAALVPTTGKTAEEWQQTLISQFAPEIPTELASGSLWGGITNIGLKLGASEQSKLSGGRELTPEEEEQVKEVAAEERRIQFAQASVFERYFDIYDSQSMVGSIFFKTPRLTTAADSFASRIISLPSMVGSVFANAFSGNVSAQGTYSYGFSSFGYSAEEQADERFENPFEVGNYFADNPDELDAMNQEYGNDCFGMTISQDGDLQYSEVSEDAGSLTDVPDKCSEDSTDLLRYRYYINYTITVHVLDCYEGLDENSCDQLYGQTGASVFATGSTSLSPEIPGDCELPAGHINPDPGRCVGILAASAQNLAPYNSPDNNQVGKKVHFDTAGEVIENKIIYGCVEIQAPDVTIRNSRIICYHSRDIIYDTIGLATGTVQAAIQATAGGATIEFNEIICGKDASGSHDAGRAPCDAGIWITDGVAQNNDIHHAVDGINPGSGATAKFNYIHDLVIEEEELARNAGAGGHICSHSDGIQVWSEGAGNVVIHGNFIQGHTNWMKQDSEGNNCGGLQGIITSNHKTAFSNPVEITNNFIWGDHASARIACWGHGPCNIADNIIDEQYKDRSAIFGLNSVIKCNRFTNGELVDTSDIADYRGRLDNSNCPDTEIVLGNLQE